MEKRDIALAAGAAAAGIVLIAAVILAKPVLPPEGNTGAEISSVEYLGL